MKILYLSAYSYPEVAASSYISDNRSQAFVEAGFDIVNYTPVPTRGIDSNTRRLYSKELKDEYKYNGRMIIHRFALMREGKNPILRAVRYLISSFIQCYKGVFARDARKCNVLFVGSTPPIQGMMAVVVKKIRKIPLVYVVQDIFPDSLVGSGLASKKGFLWRVGNIVANFTYRNASSIVVISKGFKNNLVSKGVPAEKITVIYNWVDENVTVPIKEEDNELFEEFGVSRNKFNVVYAGNLGNAQNIDVIINAAIILKDNQQIQFVIFGQGGSEEKIKETKIKEKLNNLIILPLQPYNRVSKVYGLGNVCIVSCKSGLGGAAMPSKTWNIMSSGRAVLANFDEGELKDIIEDNNCGVFTKAGDLDGFVNAIIMLSKQPDQCVKMGQNGRQFILENLTKEVGTRKYVDIIRSVIGKH